MCGTALTTYLTIKMMPKAEISRVNTLIYTYFCLLTIKISKQIKISDKLNAFISRLKWQAICLPYNTYFAAENACSKSAKISWIFSIPQERRISPAEIPAFSNSVSLNWRCVEVDGCNAQVRISAT